MYLFSVQLKFWPYAMARNIKANRFRVLSHAANKRVHEQTRRLRVSPNRESLENKYLYLIQKVRNWN